MSKTNEIYAIVDLETTGRSPASDRIIELAVIITDGTRKIEEFHSMVNPGRGLGLAIKKLTGINEMDYQDAPDFQQIAGKLFQLLEGKTLVAHHVHFDYNFLKQEFKRHGYNYRTKHLCTMRIARKMYPGLPGYSLAYVTHFLQIPNTAPHRAFGDANATFRVFRHVLNKDDEGIIEAFRKRSNRGQNDATSLIDEETLASLPIEPGVYIFRDNRGKPLYIGKAKNIRNRVRQHLLGAQARNMKLREHTVKIDHELTGSETMAMLLEDMMIKKFWPPLNQAQKEVVVRWQIVSYKDRLGRLHLKPSRVRGRVRGAFQFRDQWEARSWLQNKIDEYPLIPELCGMPQIPGRNKVENHNSAVLEIMQDGWQQVESFDVWLPGRDEDEKGVIAVRKGQVEAWGFIPEYERVDGMKVNLDELEVAGNSRFSAEQLISFMNFFSEEGEIIEL